MPARDIKSSSVSVDDSRRRRQEETISIRKNRRIQNLQKRRAMAAAASNTAATADGKNNVVNAATNAGSNNKGSVATVDQLPHIAANLKTMTPAQRFEATRSVRRMLSREENPPAADVIKAGLVPILVAELGLVTEEKTQFEAAWALTNIASTEHTRVIVQHGAVPYLVKLMMSKNPDIREQCLWCLGNVAGDGHDMRDTILKVPGALNNLLMNIKHAATPSLLANATWTLSNFCRGKPQPEISMIAPALPYLAKLITHQTLDIVGDACWALSYISDGSDERIQAVVDQKIVPTLVRLLASEKVTVVTPALRSLGNIVSGNDVQTQTCLDANIFQALKPLLEHSKRNVRKEACWALSNVAAGTPPQVEALVAQKNMLSKVMDMIENDDFEVRREAAWVMSNISTGGTTANINSIVEMGALQVICNVMDANDIKINLVVLDSLEAILRKTDDTCHVSTIEDLGGLDKLEELQDHNNEDIYRKSMSIIEEFFSETDNEDEDDSNGENQDPFTLPAENKGDAAFSGFNTNKNANPFGVNDMPQAMDWGF